MQGAFLDFAAYPERQNPSGNILHRCRGAAQQLCPSKISLHNAVDFVDGSGYCNDANIMTHCIIIPFKNIWVIY